MKSKIAFTLMVGTLVLTSFRLAPASPTWVYNGGSGPQIGLSFSGTQMTLTNSQGYDLPLRVEWSTPSGLYSEPIYSTINTYGSYNFTISGRSSSSGSSGASMYNYVP